jgi:Asp-tRNA(Asn)/Glu-tRNA(Gln) amidotransferase A subunit family amidase
LRIFRVPSANVHLRQGAPADIEHWLRSDVVDLGVSTAISPQDGLASLEGYYLESFLEHIAIHESRVRAFAHLNVESARRAADASHARYKNSEPYSVLDGIPIGIKDIINTAGFPTEYGSPIYRGHCPTVDAACVRSLIESGAIIPGKTVTTEFAIGRSGPTTNPHDIQRTPGGSSSGSAAVVAAGMLPISVGTQTHGSVLRPASFTGIYGYKPTYGALSMMGVHPLAPSLDHLGVFAHHLDDLWICASLLSERGGTIGYPGLKASSAMVGRGPRYRIARLFLKGWEEVSSSDREGFENCLESLKHTGLDIMDPSTCVALREVEQALEFAVQDTQSILRYEMRHPYTQYVKDHPEDVGERIHGLVRDSIGVSALAYEEMLQRRQSSREMVNAMTAKLGIDAFVMPASAGPAPIGLQNTGSRTYPIYWSWLGYPALSLPIMQSAGLPWGLQLAGLPNHDQDLFLIARDMLDRLQSPEQ